MSTVALRLRGRARGRTRPAWRQPLAVIGALIALAWLVVAVFAPYVAPHDPLAQIYPPSQSPSSAHLFGTDELGRDLLSRIIYGTRVALGVALLAAACGQGERGKKGFGISYTFKRQVQELVPTLRHAAGPASHHP